MNETKSTPEEMNRDSISVEVAKPEDAEVLAEILSNGVQTKIAHGDMAWSTQPYTVEELHSRIEKGNTYIARLGNVPVGTLLMAWEDEVTWGEQPPIAVYVHQLAVKEEYRGLNLGEQLLDWAAQKASQNGKELLRIDFPPENDGLKAYYEKLGFMWVQDREVHAPHSTFTAALYERPIEDQV